LFNQRPVSWRSVFPITFSPRDPGVFFYKDRQWNSPFQRQSHLFLENGARMLDDRTFFFYYATGITSAMTSPPVGSGSVYRLNVGAHKLGLWQGTPFSICPLLTMKWFADGKWFAQISAALIYFRDARQSPTRRIGHVSPICPGTSGMEYFVR
jgi:hypothetical protein